MISTLNLEKIAAINVADNVTEFDVATYGYDQLNRLLTAANSAGTVTLAYDNRGRIQSETDVFGKVLSYGYTENSTTNRKTVTFEGSLYSTYDFDDANRLTQITDNTSGVYSFTYDNVNRMISRTLPNGVVTTTNYDGLGRMKFWKNVNASSTVLNEFVYGYNTANQIISITEPSRTRNFGYDNSDRLTSTTSTQSGQNENYAYDSVGNRTSSHLSSSYDYQQGSFNRLTSTQQASYSFDSNGNMTSKSEGNDKWYYFYDRENRLVNATKFGGIMPRAGQSVGYQYDALGRRVSRQDKKTGRTEFTHDGMDVIQDRFNKSDGTNSTTSYINGLGIDNKLKLSNGTTSRYFLTDHLGSTVGMSDSSGTVTESASYDSFGRTLSSNLTTRYGYTGREADEATGLMYYRARFYDPQVGRFTSEDPIGLGGGINNYSYVNNSPMNKKDPYGLHELDVHYYLTYYLAMRTGCFTDEQARAIGNGNQGTDEDPNTMPGPGFTTKQVNQNIKYHALHPPQYQNAFLQFHWNNATQGNGDLNQLGIYLHYKQDTFSHEGFTSPVYGHLFGTHLVDKTSHNPDKAMRMAEASWDDLKRFAKEKGCKCASDTSFNDIAPQIRAFSEAKVGAGWVDALYSIDENKAYTWGGLMYKMRILGVPPRGSSIWDR